MKYKVEPTPLSNDYGADLICTKNGQVLVVQAKRYEGKVEMQRFSRLWLLKITMRQMNAW